jgi:hypothetical protein
MRLGNETRLEPIKGVINKSSPAPPQAAKRCEPQRGQGPAINHVQQIKRLPFQIAPEPISAAEPLLQLTRKPTAVADCQPGDVDSLPQSGDFLITRLNAHNSNSVARVLEEIHQGDHVKHRRNPRLADHLDAK